MGDELLHHPPYSLCLALSDYFLSPKFNKRLSGKRFGYNEEIIVQTSVKKFTEVCEALTEEIKRFLSKNLFYLTSHGLIDPPSKRVCGIEYFIEVKVRPK